jgi:hypothetical protein
MSTELGVDLLVKEALGPGPLPLVWGRVGFEGFSWMGGALKRGTGLLALGVATEGALGIATLGALGIAAEGALGPAPFGALRTATLVLVALRLATLGALRTATFVGTGASRGCLR